MMSFSIRYYTCFTVLQYFPLENILTLHNVAMLIKSVFNKNKNLYYYNVFLEKYLNQLAKK